MGAPIERVGSEVALAFHPTPANLASLYLARRALRACPQPLRQADRDALAALAAIGAGLRRQGLLPAYISAARRAHRGMASPPPSGSRSP